MISAYNYALGEGALDVFAHLSGRKRRILLHYFDRLAHDPLRSGDYSEVGASGRRYEIRLIAGILVTWWPDHAEREIRIVRLEVIEFG